MTKDLLVRATAADNQVRCIAAITTNLVGEAVRRHRTFPTASVALGRTLTGALLLGASFKDLERLTVRFHCDGPIGNILAQADAHGNARGYVTNPEADATVMNALGKFDVRAIVGGGTLYVQREVGAAIGLSKEPYSGSVPIVSGEIGDDFAYYLAKSEQINSAVGLGVLMKIEAPDSAPQAAVADAPEFALEQLRVAASGGFVIQMMPGTSDEVIAHLEDSLQRVPNPTEMVRAGMSPVDMLQTALGDLDLTVLGESEPHFKCNCSPQRARAIIASLGRDEIEDMLQKDNGAELICHYCNEAYQISGEELRQMLAEKS
jgi:molecular chaperone Hsp33